MAQGLGRCPTRQAMQTAMATPDAAINLCVEEGLLTAGGPCPHCNVGTRIPSAGKSHVEKCDNRSCRRSRCLTDGTVFQGRVPVHVVLNIFYNWLCGASHAHMKNTSGVSAATVTRVIKMISEAVVLWMDGHPYLIGGPGIVVELDESKLGKVKYGHGHRVEGVWVFGGVERGTPERKMFALPVADRTAPTLSRIIEQHVAPGTTIYTDCWRGYRAVDLMQMGMLHGTVNHRYNFVNPTTGVHTNTIEGTWHAIKAKINKRHRTSTLVNEHLQTFIWRRQNRTRLWDAFVEVIQYRAAHPVAPIPAHRHAHVLRAAPVVVVDAEDDDEVEDVAAAEEDCEEPCRIC